MNFDLPDFETEDMVSIWIATRPWTDPEWPDDYCECKSSEDGEPINQFTDDFGFVGYDIDPTESNGTEDGSLADLAPLLDEMSFAASYRSAALKAARRLGIEQTSWVWVIFDCAYDPKKTGVVESRFLRFLGAFKYDADA